MHEDARDAPPRGERDERAQVRDVGMDAAVGEEAHQVNGAARGERRVDRFDERRVRLEAPVRNRPIDPVEIGEDDPARAKAEVAHLRVPDLPRREPDRLARGQEERGGIGRAQRLDLLRITPSDRIPARGRGFAPSVHHDEPERQRLAVQDASYQSDILARWEVDAPDADRLCPPAPVPRRRRASSRRRVGG